MHQRIAVPTENGMLCEHFGHCEQFILIDIQDSEVKEQLALAPPTHEPGLYPKYLAELGVTRIIAGGMGQKARNLFQQNGIQVYTGVASAEPLELVQHYLQQSLVAGQNPCTH